jgi:hypothetical protein
MRKATQRKLYYLCDNIKASYLLTLISSQMCAFYYEELKKENIFKQKHFKMLTSYDSEEFLYSYIDDGDLNDTLKSLRLKNLQLFNKAYYQQPIKGEVYKVPAWRMKEKVQLESRGCVVSCNLTRTLDLFSKMKTVSAALVVCLNIGVDPPDVEKANQSSKIECWISRCTVVYSISPK